MPTSCLTQDCSFSSLRFSSNFCSFRSQLKWHFFRENFYVSSGPPRLESQDRIRYTRDLLQEIPVQTKGRRQEQAGKAWLQCKCDIYWRRGRRKENWAEKDYSTVLRQFQLGQWKIPKPELPIRGVMCSAVMGWHEYPCCAQFLDGHSSERQSQLQMWW